MAIRKKIGLVVETSTALPMTRAKSISIARAQECDFALPMTPVKHGVAPETPTKSWRTVRRLIELATEFDVESLIDFISQLVDKLFRQDHARPVNSRSAQTL